MGGRVLWPHVEGHVAPALGGLDDAFDRDAADLLLIAPSNPVISIGPVLAIRGMRV